MKDTLIETKNNLTVEWMKPRIKSMISNIRKQKKKNNQSGQEEKIIEKKRRTL